MWPMRHSHAHTLAGPGLRIWVCRLSQFFPTAHRLSLPHAKAFPFLVKRRRRQKPFHSNGARLKIMAYASSSPTGQRLKDFRLKTGWALNEWMKAREIVSSQGESERVEGDVCLWLCVVGGMGRASYVCVCLQLDIFTALGVSLYKGSLRKNWQYDKLRKNWRKNFRIEKLTKKFPKKFQENFPLFF